MAGQIKITRVSTKKYINISNIKTENITATSCNISFDILEEEYDQSFKMFLIMNNRQKQEITNLVLKIGNTFTYTAKNLLPLTSYDFYILLEKDNECYFSQISSFDTIAQVYGVRVDESNQDPEASCTYIEGAVGVQTATRTSLGGWINKFPYNEIKIVGLKNGIETGDINPNDKTKYTSGAAVPGDVDVMVKIPKVYWDFENTTSGYNLRIGSYKFNSTCDCYAHKVGGIEKDFIYVGVYLGYNENSKLRSKSGVSPTTSTTLSNFRNFAHSVGQGYEQMNWFTLVLLQNLYLIAYKNLNSQQALGSGASNLTGKINTGGTNTKGMIFGETNGRQQMCFLGIEDLWGNILQWIDGMYYNSSYQILVTPDNKNFNNNGSGFKNIGYISNSSGANGRISKVVHSNEGGYFPKELTGNGSNYYCDYGCIRAGFFGRFGGRFNHSFDCGIFHLDVYYGATESGGALGSRLVYLG